MITACRGDVSLGGVSGFGKGDFRCLGAGAVQGLPQVHWRAWATQVWRGPVGRVALFFQEQIQGPENAPIARFDGLGCYQSSSETSHAFRGAGVGLKRFVDELWPGAGSMRGRLPVCLLCGGVAHFARVQKRQAGRAFGAQARPGLRFCVGREAYGWRWCQTVRFRAAGQPWASRGRRSSTSSPKPVM